MGLIVEYNSTGLGSVAEYMCINDDDELVGEPHIFCQSNGVWSGENNSLYCLGTILLVYNSGDILFSDTGSQILYIVAGCVGGIFVVIFLLIITIIIAVFIKMYKFSGK